MAIKRLLNCGYSLGLPGIASGCVLMNTQICGLAGICKRLRFYAVTFLRSGLMGLREIASGSYGLIGKNGFRGVYISICI